MSVSWTSWVQAKFETDVLARSYNSHDPKIAAAIVLQASVLREDQMRRREQMWK